MNFSDQIRADARMFLDIFGATHEVDGKPVQAMLDRERAVTDSGGYRSGQEGVYAEIITLRASSEDVALPAIGQAMSLDGREYLVTGAVDEHGINAVTLIRNDS